MFLKWHYTVRFLSYFAAEQVLFVPTELKVVRAFLFLGLFAQIGALVVLNFMTFGKITKPYYASIAFGLAGGLVNTHEQKVVHF